MAFAALIAVTAGACRADRSGPYDPERSIDPKCRPLREQARSLWTDEAERALVDGFRRATGRSEVPQATAVVERGRRTAMAWERRAVGACEALQDGDLAQDVHDRIQSCLRRNLTFQSVVVELAAEPTPTAVADTHSGLDGALGRLEFCDVEEVHRHMRPAASTADAAAAERADLMTARATVLGRFRRYEEADAAAQEAEAAAKQSGDPARRVRAFVAFDASGQPKERFPGVIERADEYRELANESGDRDGVALVDEIVGLAHYVLGEREQGDVLEKRALEVYTALGPGFLGTVYLEAGLGIRELNAGDDAAANARMEKLASLRGQVTDVDVRAAIDRMLLSMRARQARYQNKCADALALYAEYKEVLELRYGADLPGMSSVYTGIAECLRVLGEHETALGYLQKSLAVDELSWGADDPRLANSYAFIGRAFADAGKLETGTKYLEEALRRARAHYGEDHNDLAAFHSELGQAQSRAGRHERAIENLVRAVELRERAHGADDVRVGRARYWLGLGYVRAGRNEESLAQLERALGIFEGAADKAGTGEVEAVREAVEAMKKKIAGEAGDAGKGKGKGK